MGAERTDFKWVAIVLAAGSSSRMGRPKQLIKIDNETLIRKTAHAARDAGTNEIIVVVAPDHESIKGELMSLPVHFAVNPDRERGMGNSLKRGLHFMLKETPGTDAVLILVCDQPKLNSVHIRKMIDLHKRTGNPIIASYYSSQNGVPVLFHKSMFEKLLTIDDQHGAKKIIEQYPALVKSIEFPEGAIDLDTPEDLEKFKM